MIDAAELHAFYMAIQRGDVVLTTTHHPQWVYAANVEYRASNGWRIVVFNDANEFDYIDHIRTPDGREVDLNEIELTPLDWVPDEETAWMCFGIPGYMKFRCTDCGAELGPIAGPPFQCGVGRCVVRRSPPMPTRARVEPHS